MLTLAALRTAMADKAALQTKLDDAIARITTLEGELATANSTASAEKTRADGLQAQIDEANSTIDQLNGKVTTLEKDKKDVSTATIDKLHELGVPAAELPAGGVETKDDAAVYAEWKSLTGGAKTKFRQENAAALQRYADSQG